MEKNIINAQDNLFISEIDGLNFPFPFCLHTEKEKEFDSFDEMSNIDICLDRSSQDYSTIKQVKFITENNKTPFFISKKIGRKNKKKDENVSVGRWTKEERIKFAYGLWKFGANWIKMKEIVSTRSLTQINSHAQKFLSKLKSNNELIKKGFQLNRLSWNDIIKLLKNNFNDIEALNILISIESEIGDNNRMTKKYLERKKMNSMTKFCSSIEETNISSSSSEENSNNNIENRKNYLLNKEEIKTVDKEITLNEQDDPFRNVIEDNNFNYYHLMEDKEKDNILYNKYINNNDSLSFDHSFYLFQ